jgi:hypothetical protein
MFQIRVDLRTSPNVYSTPQTPIDFSPSDPTPPPHPFGACSPFPQMSL